MPTALAELSTRPKAVKKSHSCAAAIDRLTIACSEAQQHPIYPSDCSSFVARNIDTFDSALVTDGQQHAGTAYDVISEADEMELSVLGGPARAHEEFLAGGAAAVRNDYFRRKRLGEGNLRRVVTGKAGGQLFGHAIAKALRRGGLELLVEPGHQPAADAPRHAKIAFEDSRAGFNMP
jgi:hypothetical protein